MTERAYLNDIASGLYMVVYMVVHFFVDISAKFVLMCWCAIEAAGLLWR